MSRRFRGRAPAVTGFLMAVAAVLAAAGTASGQTVAQIGSGGASGDAGEAWVLGFGYNVDFPALPFEVGILLQSGTGVETNVGMETARQFPVRAFATARMGLLPVPGFSLYLGGGAGAATWLGGGAEGGLTPAGIGFAGFEVGRLHLEVQLQREFHEEPRNRWVTVVGVTF